MIQSIFRKLDDHFVLTSMLTTVGISCGALLTYFYFTSGRKSKKKVQKKLIGMHNLGSTCFANALLQSLASCSSFSGWLDKMASTTDDDEHLILLRELSKVISNLNSGDVGEISAEGILYALKKHDWIVGMNREHDLFELLNVFVTTWDEEIAAASTADDKSTSLVDVKHLDCEFTEEKSLHFRGSDYLRHLSSLVELQSSRKSPCNGLIGTQFHCRNCGHKYVRHDKFCNLTLSLTKGGFCPIVTLESCLRKYFAVEKLYNVTCESCQQKSSNPAVGQSEFFKKQGISKLPDCLILRIERLGWLPSGVAFKQNDFVQFAETLDVRDFVFYRSKSVDYDAGVVGGKSAFTQPAAPPSSFNNLRALSQADHGFQQQAVVSGVSPLVVDAGRKLFDIRYKYRLNAAVVHLGNQASGHFVTYRRGPSPSDSASWYYTSDLEVRKVTFEEVANCEAYMLFYERVLKI